MKKIILTVATLALTLVLAADSQANPKTSQGSPSKSGSMNGNFKDYHLTHGTKFDHGFFYRGKNHDHWGERRFDSRYGCEVYWDRGLSRWFYWCERDICFYPVTYCPYRVYVCPPVIVEPVRPIRPLVAEPVRPAPIRPLVAEPVVVPPVTTEVNVNVRTTTAAR